MINPPFGGYRVMVMPDRPVMQLGEAVKAFLTPEQIADHNAWMVRFFGTENVFKDDEIIVDNMYCVFHMNPRGYERFKAACTSVKR